MNIKLLEENIGVNLNNHELGNGFLGTTPKAQMLKEKKWTISAKTFVLQMIPSRK